MEIDNKMVMYVAQSGVQQIARYEVTDDRRLEPMTPIAVMAGMDNFWLDPQTKLLTIAGHPKPWVRK